MIPSRGKPSIGKERTAVMKAITPRHDARRVAGSAELGQCESRKQIPPKQVIARLPVIQMVSGGAVVRP